MSRELPGKSCIWLAAIRTGLLFLEQRGSRRRQLRNKGLGPPMPAVVVEFVQPRRLKIRIECGHLTSFYRGERPLVRYHVWRSLNAIHPHFRVHTVRPRNRGWGCCAHRDCAASIETPGVSCHNCLVAMGWMVLRSSSEPGAGSQVTKTANRLCLKTLWRCCCGRWNRLPHADANL